MSALIIGIINSIGSSKPTSRSVGDFILAENNNYIITESGDDMIIE